MKGREKIAKHEDGYFDANGVEMEAVWLPHSVSVAKEEDGAVDDSDSWGLDLLHGVSNTSA